MEMAYTRTINSQRGIFGRRGFTWEESMLGGNPKSLSYQRLPASLCVPGGAALSIMKHRQACVPAPGFAGDVWFLTISLSPADVHLLSEGGGTSMKTSR